MDNEFGPVPAAVDLTRPSIARVYDFFLGGRHKTEADRQVARTIAEMMPDLPAVLRANRAFLHRAVRFLLHQGIRQFLDLGSGLATNEPDRLNTGQPQAAGQAAMAPAPAPPPAPPPAAREVKDGDGWLRRADNDMYVKAKVTFERKIVLLDVSVSRDGSLHAVLPEPAADRAGSVPLEYMDGTPVLLIEVTADSSGQLIAPRAFDLNRLYRD
ncbi:SAM-dependent methyltransferase [Streptomyces sp. NPDC048419]|uniref:SAM-dependent methyltransferase n=1 Tax=Streptomyces sp. NPDC048419 TaxID=3365547 RepID=UPI00371C0C77